MISDSLDHSITTKIKAWKSELVLEPQIKAIEDVTINLVVTH